jgi:hypothetical protein
MKNILMLLLILIALAMIFISYKAGIPAPALTGLGFIIIALLFFTNNKE